jgi:hypothetical protein
MTMKALTNNRIAGTIILFLFVSSQVFSQGGPGYRQLQENKGKIKAHKIAFLTDRLDLTPEEAEKFWPIFNKHEEMVETERESFRKAHDFTPEDIMAMSDDEANDFLDAQIKHEETLHQLRKDLTSSLKEVLPPQKILMLHEANQEFKLELMKRLRDRQGPGPKGVNR